MTEEMTEGIDEARHLRHQGAEGIESHHRWREKGALPHHLLLRIHGDLLHRAEQNHGRKGDQQLQNVWTMMRNRSGLPP